MRIFHGNLDERPTNVTGDRRSYPGGIKHHTCESGGSALSVSSSNDNQAGTRQGPSGQLQFSHDLHTMRAGGFDDMLIGGNSGRHHGNRRSSDPLGVVTAELDRHSVASEFSRG